MDGEPPAPDRVGPAPGRGRPVKTVGDDLFPTSRRLRRKDPLLAAMWPQRSQEHEGDSILFVRRGEIFTIAPEPGQQPRLVDVTAQSPKSAPTWSPDHRHMAFLSGGGRTQNLWVRQPSGAADKVEGLSGRLVLESRLQTDLRGEQERRRLPAGGGHPRHPGRPHARAPSAARRPPAGQRRRQPRRGVRARRGRPPQPPGRTPSPSRAASCSWASSARTASSTGRTADRPGLGRVFSPVWVDPVTVAFIAETSNKDDLGKLWTIKSDGWDPTAVFNDSDIPIGDIGNHLAVDPAGRSFVVTARTTNGSSLWMVNRLRKSVDYLTSPPPTPSTATPASPATDQPWWVGCGWGRKRVGRRG